MGEVFDHMLKRWAKLLPVYDLILITFLFNITYSLSVLGCPIEGKRDGGMPTSCFMSALMLLTKAGQLMLTEVSTGSVECKGSSCHEVLRCLHTRPKHD